MFCGRIENVLSWKFTFMFLVMHSRWPAEGKIIVVGERMCVRRRTMRVWHTWQWVVKPTISKHKYCLCLTEFEFASHIQYVPLEVLWGILKPLALSVLIIISLSPLLGLPPFSFSPSIIVPAHTAALQHTGWGETERESRGVSAEDKKADVERDAWWEGINTCLIYGQKKCYLQARKAESLIYDQ